MRKRRLTCETLESRQLLAADLVISELMASNASSLLDEDRDTSDWIEVHNPTETPIDLAGWTISDDVEQLNKWTFPSVSIGPGQFLVIFASGKDRRATADALHTNFKLAKSGEFLGLGRPDGTIAHQFAPGYPSQQTDLSYGLDASDDTSVGFMTVPSPGAPNEQVFVGFASDSSISVAGGIFDQPFDVQISTDMADAVIRYTTDGSEPTQTNGEVYSGPITIESTTTLRARATKSDHIPGAIETSTLLFLEDVLEQTQPANYPNLRSGDYDVDPEIALSAQYKNRLVEGLGEIPSLSLVLPPDDFVGRRGIYVNPESRGAIWERATSVELIDPDGTTQQIDAGVRIQGGASRSPSTTPKHSFSLRFRDRYGDGPLEYPLFDNSPVERFTSLSLRGGSNNSWTSNNAVERRNAQSIRDQWIRDALLAMGHSDAGRGSYVHVYVNGLYWGLYNLTERPDADHYATYFGGDAESLDAFNGNQVIDGSQEALDEMKAIAATGDLSALQAVVDLDRYIDYTILNRYGSNGDLDVTRNYRMAGGGPDRALWRVYPWDSEEVLVNAGSTGKPADPVGLRLHIEQDPEFIVRFGDRLQKHLFNGGALTPEVAAELWRARAEEIDLAIIGETARWGDHRRPDRPYTRDEDWLGEQNRLLKDYFPRRTDVLLGLYRSEGLFPNIDAPAFNQHGGVIPREFDIGLSAAAGTIHYTTDGGDPRLTGGAVSESAKVFTAPLNLVDDTTIKTRVLYEGEWSALNEAHFIVSSDLPLRVSEINFNPHDARLVEEIDELEVDNDQFEFIELTNIGDHTIDLQGVRFIETQVEFRNQGLSFVFAGQQLEPGKAVVVVRNREAFVSRYGGEISIAIGNDGRGGADGEFAGELADHGELITLLDSRGRTVQQFDFSRPISQKGVRPLSVRTRGHGSSLQIIDPRGSYTDHTNWVASHRFGGSPGDSTTSTALGDVVISELRAKDAPAIDGWIELLNTTREPIDIGGWYLSDSIDDLLKSQVAIGVTIGNEDYLTIGQSQLGFRVDRIRGGSLWLIESDDRGVPLRFVDQIEFETSREGTSVGRSLADPHRMIPLTQSTPNRRNRSAAIGDVVISEINYHARDFDGEGLGQQANNFEYIELVNRSEVEIDLSGWRLTGDIDLSFRRGPALGPGGSVVAVSFAPNRSTQADPFRTAYGIDRSVALAGPYLGRLSNSRGVVRLERPLAATPHEPFLVPYLVVDEVMFESQLPWPESLNSSGDTLTRTKPNALGNFASSWSGDAPTPGATDLPLRWTGDANVDGRFDTSDLVHAMQAGKYETAIAATFAEGDWNRDGVFDSADLLMAAATDRFEAPA